MASVSPCCSTSKTKNNLFPVPQFLFNIAIIFFSRSAVVLVPLSTIVEAWSLPTRGNMKMAAKATGDLGSHLHKFTKVYAYCRFLYRKENYR